MLSPTYEGYIDDIWDVLLLIQAVMDKTLQDTPRRPLEHERDRLIKSGHTFAFFEKKSNMKRWTDGIPWSPSRILGQFLIYKQLSQRRSKSAASSSSGVGGSGSGSVGSNNPKDKFASFTNDGFGFKENGLIKKTVSLKINNDTVHVISYYDPKDVQVRRLENPKNSQRLKNVNPCPELLEYLDQRKDKDPMDDIYALPNQHAQHYPFQNDALTELGSIPQHNSIQTSSTAGSNSSTSPQQTPTYPMYTSFVSPSPISTLPRNILSSAEYGTQYYRPDYANESFVPYQSVEMYLDSSTAQIEEPASIRSVDQSYNYIPQYPSYGTDAYPYPQKERAYSAYHHPVNSTAAPYTFARSRP